MSDLGPLDLALLPVWGWGASVGPGHLDPEAGRASADAASPSTRGADPLGHLLPGRPAAAAPGPAGPAAARVRPPGARAGAGGRGTGPSAGLRDITGEPMRARRRISRGRLGGAAGPPALAADRADLLGVRGRGARDRRAQLWRGPADHRSDRAAQRAALAAADPAAAAADRIHLRPRLAGAERRDRLDRDQAGRRDRPGFPRRDPGRLPPLGQPDAAGAGAEHRRRRQPAARRPPPGSPAPSRPLAPMSPG